MSRITGTVSRTVPLDPVIGRPLSLTGTFDLFVSASELAAITPVLDSLLASGIMTAAQRFVESDSLIASVTAPVVDALTTGTVSPSPVQVIPITIPDAANTTYTYTTQRKIEFVDMVVHKVGNGAANTIQLQDAAAAAITDAVAAAVDKAVTRAGTIDRTKNQVAAGATFKILATRAAGTMAAEVYLLVIFR